MDWISELIVQNIPSLLCLVVGFILVVIEMYIPGFGAPGVIGGILLVAGITLRARTPLEALIMTIVIVALLCIVLSLSIRSASKGRLANSKFVLHEVSLHEVSDVSGTPIGENDLDYFVGQTGTTKTVLRPAGIGEFDGVRLNIVSKGEFIPKDVQVTVECVEGNRIVVNQTEG